MIHVCFGLHDETGRYSKFTGTAMLSLFDNTRSEVTVHILHDNTLSIDNREKFSYLAGQYNQHVKFYNVELLCKDKINLIRNNLSERFKKLYSIAAIYRFLIPYIFTLDIDKVVYLDSDTIVNRDINELWQIELDSRPIAAVPEIFNGVNTAKSFRLCHDGLVKPEDYFNSGVLLMNLNSFRDAEKNLLNTIKFIGENPQYTSFDQDVLNLYFSTAALKLPNTFNRFVNYSRTSNELTVDKKIYNYVWISCQLNMSDPFNRLWMSYFMRTPWFNEDTIGRLYAGFRQIHVGLKGSLINLSTVLSGKTRAFFAAPNDIDKIKRLFAIRDDEKIIPAENQESLQKLLDAMKKARGRRLFFIMLPNFPFKVLINAGFVPNRDFVNGMDFLSEAQGIPFNSYELVKAM